MVKRAWLPVFRRSLVFDIVALSQQRIPSQTWQIVKCGEMTKLTPYLFLETWDCQMKLKRNQLNYIRPTCPFSFLQATNVCSHMSVSSKPIHPSTFKVDSLQEVCMSTASQAMAQHPNIHRLNSSCKNFPMDSSWAAEGNFVSVAVRVPLSVYASCYLCRTLACRRKTHCALLVTALFHMTGVIPVARGGLPGCWSAHAIEW